ncbi:hypothetical protein [Klebsiella quasipneumoniae]|uniref:hypothetical protein n=1 Tax=Klebsiella quasipneumoniae TaxID=1463165 RepID=UPI001AB051C2|nr:hypothetical protein [Klebsiella quasipneumoniae]MBO3251697.1 hypothetical protein [Klebsiella quasipneumoniae]
MRIFQIMEKGCKFINGNQWIVVRGIETEAKSHAMFLVPEFIEKLESLGRCEQVPDMRSSYSSGAHPRGTS